MVQSYNSSDTVIPWNNKRFVLSERSDCHMVDNLSMAVHAIPMGMLTSLSVDEILLPSYVKWSTNFRGYLEWKWYHHYQSSKILLS